MVALWVAAIAPVPADALSKSDVAAYRAAFKAAQAEKWQQASDLAAKAKEKLPRKVLDWMRYKAADSGAGFSEIAAFIGDNPDWPDLWLLRRRAEETIPTNIPDSDLMAWFNRFPPTTAPGSVRYARILIAAGRSGDATAVIRDAWATLDMTAAEEKGFSREFHRYLRREDHVARLDRLIWDERIWAARRQMRHVDQDHRYLAEARIMLFRQQGGVDNAIARVPDALRDHPGLIYERLRWRRRKDFTESAMELLQNPPGDLIRPEKWWIERAILARHALRNGDISLAYRLARNHGPVSGAALAEAEWLAGWIALRFLRDNDVAFRHFTTMYDNVRYPISLARGAYWAGRAAEASGGAHLATARKWYGAAAEHFTTYYGLLALNRLAAPAGPIREPVPNGVALERFDGLESVRLARMLAELEQDDLVETFLDNLIATAEGETHWALVAQLANEIGRHDLSVRVSKRAIRDGIVLAEAGYPALPVALDIPADRVLVHAVIRQESAFDANATSGAGARGLMQLMPATAKWLAGQMNVPHSHERLADPTHNLNLGSTYLARMIDRFDGSVVLALAAYNAGPGRVNRWLAEYGDPRDGEILSAVDWVESIPYSETRNYVQRVLENLPVYGYRLRDEFNPLSLVEALTGSNRASVP